MEIVQTEGVVFEAVILDRFDEFDECDEVDESNRVDKHRGIALS